MCKKMALKLERCQSNEVLLHKKATPFKEEDSRDSRDSRDNRDN